MPTKFMAIYWPAGLDGKNLLEEVDDLARKDGRSRSWVIREAMKEYVANHSPGNPQTDLRTYPADDGTPLPKPKTVQKMDEEAFVAKHASAITFLMKTKNVSQDEAVKSVKRIYPEDLE